VRADHTGVCGYERPNTPFLSSLVEDGGASVSCSTYAPGSWTMPSHASFFTGTAVPEHGVHFVLPTDEDKQVFEGTGFYTRPMDDRFETLAEHYAAKGYQTISVAANPLIGGDTGLTRGFEHALVENSPGWKVVRTIVSHLRWTADRDRPLFLFVNFGDAHEPWEPVPSGLDWVPPRDAYGWGGPWSPYGLDDLVPSMYPRTDEFDRLMRREMPEAEKAAWMAHITDLYDYGILLADDAVRQLVDGLEAHGWAEDGLRLVVTSDHGEHLGEHDLGDHGRFATEPVVRIPVVAWDASGSPTLREPMAGTELFHLVRDWALPPEPHDVATYAFGDVMWDKHYGRGGDNAIGVVGGGEKLLWTNGVTLRVALDDDPTGLAPGPVDPTSHPLAGTLERAVQRVEGADTEGSGLTDDMVRRLQEIGYVDGP
jgi:arylsulfatase A-like enzyme